MKRAILSLIICLSLSPIVLSQTAGNPNTAPPDETSFLQSVKASIDKNLGRPYVWGSAGLKSFDCSGFVWRVLYENGILMKRTTARKYYMMLKPAPKTDQWKFGTLVFFDDLKHVGIVDDSSAFYHAQVSIGTNRSPMNSFWRPKVYGFRLLPTPSESKLFSW
jgi:cell wall-associated NlpC family hydrolase